MKAALLLHRLAKSPAQDGCADVDATACWLCGCETTRGMPVSRWQGSNFTDQNKARRQDSELVCEACCWACAWNVPPGFPPPEPGKKGLNLRLFSHLYDDRGYLALNKAKKPEILRWLREPKQGRWFAAIADTGQKHLLPWTPLNPAGSAAGVVRFEERTVRLGDFAIVDSMTRMLSGGVTKAEIATGDYSVRTWREFEPATVRAFESMHARIRGTAWFELALWLSQRDEEIYETTRRGKARSAAEQDRKRAARNAKAVSRGRRKPAQALGADPRPDADGGTNKRKRRRVGDGAAEVAEDPDAQQRAFDFDP